MKNKVLFILFLLSICATAQKSIPTNIKVSFATKYPDVKKVKWEKEAENFEVGFVQNNQKCSALLNDKGDILETEFEIPIAKLQKSILDYVAKNYAGQKIKSAAQITDSSKKVSYEAEVNGNDLLFDDEGNFIKATKN